MILRINGHAERLSHAPLTNDLISRELRGGGEPKRAPERQDTSFLICASRSFPFWPLYNFLR